MKKKIRIKFSGMGGRFNENDNFISNIIKEHFEIELSDNPEILFYSVNSSDYLKYQCVRVFYTGENLVPDFNICDYAIGFSKLTFGDRYIRFPIYLVSDFNAYIGDDYGSDLKRAEEKHCKIENKNEFCAFTYSNSEGAPCRTAIFEALSRYKKVNSGGRYLNNVGGAVENKLEFQSKHKFVIAFENTSTPGYTTEKIVHAFAAGAIPIYWGNPQITEEFNEDSFINCHKYGLTDKGEVEAIEKIVDKVKQIDQNTELYHQMIATPAFTKDNDIRMVQNEFKNFILNICNQDLSNEAFRRNRYYWGERYERKQKIGNQIYWQLRKLIPIRDNIRKLLRTMK